MTLAYGSVILSSHSINGGRSGIIIANRKMKIIKIPTTNSILRATLLALAFVITLGFSAVTASAKTIKPGYLYGYKAVKIKNNIYYCSNNCFYKYNLKKKQKTKLCKMEKVDEDPILINYNNVFYVQTSKASDDKYYKYNIKSNKQEYIQNNGSFIGKLAGKEYYLKGKKIIRIGKDNQKETVVKGVKKYGYTCIYGGKLYYEKKKNVFKMSANGSKKKMNKKDFNSFRNRYRDFMFYPEKNVQNAVSSAVYYNYKKFNGWEDFKECYYYNNKGLVEGFKKNKRVVYKSNKVIFAHCAFKDYLLVDIGTYNIKKSIFKGDTILITKKGKKVATLAKGVKYER
ncbi:MAG: hypothetical protein K5656_03090 [Lachnospiraceae bacterium]|nr:hypothetical protein [Lachnospiraceae bacterium]